MSNTDTTIDPLTMDTDGDGLSDGEETTLGTDPSNADTEGDGLDDGREVSIGTDPNNFDSDGVDSDGDALNNVREVQFGSERGVRVLALLFVLALVVAACGDDSADTTGPDFPTGRLVGEFRAFEFNADGTFGFFLERTSDDPAVEGTYSVDGDLYTEMTSDFTACSFPGTYTWTYEGENLAFHLDGEDACEYRVAAYDGKTFTRSQ